MFEDREPPAPDDWAVPGVPRPRPVALSAAVLAVRAAVDALAAEEVDGQPGEAVLAAVVTDGVRMLVAEARGGLPTGDDPVLAELLVELPRIAALPTTQLARLEAALLVLAQHVEAGQLPGCLGLLVDALLEQRARRAERGRDRRRLRLVRHHDGGGWHLDGDLDLECGKRLFAVLQSEMTRDPDDVVDTEQAAALREQGLDPYDPSSGPSCPRAASPSAGTTRCPQGWAATSPPTSGAATTRARCRSS